MTPESHYTARGEFEAYCVTLSQLFDEPMAEIEQFNPGWSAA